MQNGSIRIIIQQNKLLLYQFNTIKEPHISRISQTELIKQVYKIIKTNFISEKCKNTLFSVDPYFDIHTSMKYEKMLCRDNEIMNLFSIGSNKYIFVNDPGSKHIEISDDEDVSTCCFADRNIILSDLRQLNIRNLFLSDCTFDLRLFNYYEFSVLDVLSIKNFNFIDAHNVDHQLLSNCSNLRCLELDTNFKSLSFMASMKNLTHFKTVNQNFDFDSLVYLMQKPSLSYLSFTRFLYRNSDFIYKLLLYAIPPQCKVYRLEITEKVRSLSRAQCPFPQFDFNPIRTKRQLKDNCRKKLRTTQQSQQSLRQQLQIITKRIQIIQSKLSGIETLVANLE